MYNHLDCNYSSSNLNSKNIKLLAILQKKKWLVLWSRFLALCRQTSSGRSVHKIMTTLYYF